MCHFYGNSLSVLNGIMGNVKSFSEMLQPQHYEAIRMLPSFRGLVESKVDERDIELARELFVDDTELLLQANLALQYRATGGPLRAMHIISSVLQEPVDGIELYLAATSGDLSETDFARRVIDSTKRMEADELLVFINKVVGAMEGSTELGLDEWANDNPLFTEELTSIQEKVSALAKEAEETGNPVRSSYAIHSKGVRTTVIAQRVQLSYEKSTLTKQDKEFTSLVDRLCKWLTESFTVGNPREVFLSEVWTYDSTFPYRDAFTPHPRSAVEHALSTPYNYMDCECCESVEGISGTNPTTAILYQMYLETGSLINIADLWAAFSEMVSQDKDDEDERNTLVLFYRALVDLKLLGMVKQSKKKPDHLAKVSWKGL
jgi:origin recognition complex subunit 3